MPFSSFPSIREFFKRNDYFLDITPVEIRIYGSEGLLAREGLPGHDKSAFSNFAGISEAVEAAFSRIQNRGFKLRGPRILATVDPSWAAKDLPPIRKQLRKEWPKEIYFIDRFLASCSAISEISSATIRTPVIYMMGDRIFGAIYFQGSLFDKKIVHAENGLDASELFSLVMSFAGNRPFPGSSFSHHKKGIRIQLEKLWESDFDPKIHFIVEKEDFKRDSSSLAEMHRVHISDPDISFAYAGLKKYYHSFVNPP